MATEYIHELGDSLSTGNSSEGPHVKVIAPEKYKVSGAETYKTISDEIEKVKQTEDHASTGTGFEVLFSGTGDSTTRTEGTRKSSLLTFQPSTGTLTALAFAGTASVAKAYDTSFSGTNSIAGALGGKVDRVVVTDLANWDTLTGTGIYEIESQASGVVNSPEPGRMTLVVINSDGYIVQVAYGDNTYRRSQPSGGSFNPWVQLVPNTTIKNVVAIDSSSALSITIPRNVRSGRSTALVMVSGNNAEFSLLQLSWFKAANDDITNMKIHIVAYSGDSDAIIPKPYAFWGASDSPSIIALVLNNSNFSTNMMVQLNTEKNSSIEIGTMSKTTAQTGADLSSIVTKTLQGGWDAYPTLNSYNVVPSNGIAQAIYDMTSNYKIQVVSTLPANPSSDTIYFV